MKYLHIVLKVLLTLVMIMPICGALHLFPAPTADMYNTAEGWAFIQMIMDGGYINPIMGIVFTLSIFCLWTKREALAALLILPLTVNIIAFHLFLDGGLFTAGAVLADILLVLNIYFLYQNRAEYKPLLKLPKMK